MKCLPVHFQSVSLIESSVCLVLPSVSGFNVSVLPDSVCELSYELSVCPISPNVSELELSVASREPSSVSSILSVMSSEIRDAFHLWPGNPVTDIETAHGPSTFFVIQKVSNSESSVPPVSVSDSNYELSVCSVLTSVSEFEPSASPVLVTEINGEMSTCPVFPSVSDCELSALSFFVCVNVWTVCRSRTYLYQ